MRKKTFILTLFFVIGIWQNVFAVDYPKFLTFPFVKRSVPIYNGWYYYFDGSNHKGIDYDLSYEALVAAADGVVETVYSHDVQYSTFPTGDNAATRAYGNHIVIDHGNGYKTLYAHMDSFNVCEGQPVTRGQMIGISGHTGYSTAPHLHFEIHGPENGGEYSNGYWKYDPYAIYSINKSLYEDTVSNAMDDTERLWTTNPPSYSYYVPMFNYTFPNNSSEGWTEGNNVVFMSGGDTDSMYMNITGTNPGFVSPLFCPAVYNANCPNVYADEVVIQFRAKVIGRSSSPTEPVTVYVKDQNDSWANSLTLETVDDADYHYYVAYLSDIINASTKLVKQFSIELTEGSTSGNEYWEFDEVKVVYIGGQQVTTADKYLSTTFVPDQNDNDVTELAVMRVHPVTGQPTVTVIDGSSGDTLTEIYFGDSNIIPKIITGISTPNGTALRVVGTDKRNSSEYVEQRYVKSGALVE